MADYRCRCCKQPLMERGEFFPFCSKRCQSNDLGAWASGAYAIPGEPAIASDLPMEDHTETGTQKKSDAH